MMTAVVLLMGTSLNVWAEDIVLKHEPGMDNQVTVSEDEEGILTVTTSGGDPFMALTKLPRPLADDENIVLVEYQASKSVPDAVEFFFSPIAGGREQNFDTGFAATEGDEWRVAYMDITDSRKRFGWGDKDDYFRFDLGNQDGLTLRIRSIRITSLSYDRTEVVKIGTADELQAFMDRVNSQCHYGISAELTSDIDFTGHNTRIACLEGTLNGNGHAITVDYNVPGSYAALVEVLKGTVENLIVKGRIATAGKYGASVAGRTMGATIRNCASYVDILPTIEGDGTHGGFVGNNASGVTIENCIFAGSIISNETTNCGGFVGWSGSSTVIKNSAQVADIQLPESDLNVWARNFGACKISNCFYVNPVNSTNAGANENIGTQVSGEMVTNGALCFLLNGDQSVISWTQTLGTDECPVPFTTHQQVYASGEIRCDGQPLGELTYSNTGSVSVPDHHYENGVCTVCGQLNLHQVEPGEDGFLPLGSTADFVWFAKMVDAGYTSLKARLTADIDLADAEIAPIGTTSDPFVGTFDGGNHRISNLFINMPEQKFVGLFGCAADGADFRNFVLDKSCSITGLTFVGVLGGTSTAGTVSFTNVGNEGIVTAMDQNPGGIVGCTEGSNCKFLLTNCYVTGSVTGAREAAAFGGWFGNQGSRLVNCWTIAEVEGHSGDNVYVGRGENVSYVNCYSLRGSQVNSISEEAVASGDLCYKLNGNSFANPAFYQTLDEDNYPVLDPTHGLVYTLDGENYSDIHDEASFKNFTKEVAENAEEMTTKVVTKSLLDEFQEAMTALKAITEREAYLEQYFALQPLRESLQESARAYSDYFAKVEETIEFLDANTAFDGPSRQLLESYLMETIEPSEALPNGSYSYIYEQHVLTTEQVRAEIQFIDDLLNAALSEGYTKGADLTALLVNSDFTDGFNGWQGKVATGYGTNGEMRAAECYGTTFDMYQKLEGLADGVYELQVNAAFRPCAMPSSTNYAAMIYANDNKVYVQADIEDMIPADQAEDLVNCWIGENAAIRDLEIYDDLGENLLGYVLHGVQSCCYAFGAGRYQNRILANVTDGKLTVGICSPGTGLANDWTGFGNIRLTYCGSLEEATADLDNTLAGMVARANTLLSYEFSSGEDYKAYPNFSNELRDGLTAAIAGVASASSAEEKYALVQQFSGLFQQVYDCKKIYTKLIDKMEAVYDAYTGFETEDPEVIALMEKVEASNAQAWEGYEGLFSQQQAEDFVNALETEYQFYTTLNPAAMVNSINITKIAPFDYLVECQGSDPYVAWSPLEEDLTPEQNYITFEYKANQNVRGEFFYSPIAAGRDVWYDALPATEEWTRAFISIESPKKKLNWGKAGDFVRWDPVQDGYPVIEIRYMEYITEAEKEYLETGIGSVEEASPLAPAPQNIYTLDGRLYRVGTDRHNLPAGLYIIGGKKYLVK